MLVHCCPDALASIDITQPRMEPSPCYISGASWLTMELGLNKPIVSWKYHESKMYVIHLTHRISQFSPQCPVAHQSLLGSCGWSRATVHCHCPVSGESITEHMASLWDDQNSKAKYDFCWVYIASCHCKNHKVRHFTLDCTWLTFIFWSKDVQIDMTRFEKAARNSPSPQTVGSHVDPDACSSQ
jgi:hypothetical protein